MDTKEVMTWATGSGLVTQGRGDAPINRAEAATLIMRKFNLASDAREAHPFADVEPGSWYYEAAMACRRFGVFRGDAANHFSGSTALDPQAAFALVARCGAIRPLTGDEQRTLAGTW